MASSVIGALRVDLGLNSAQFTTGLNQAQSSLGRFGKSTAAIHSNMDKLASRLAASTIGALSLAAAMHKTREALDQFGDIADKARSAGLDPEFFQGLAYAAKQTGVGVESLSGALDTFNKNVGLATEGKGKLVSQLQALNPELLKNIQLSTTQEERILAVADALAAEGDMSRQAAIATAAFGDQGTKLVAALDMGGAAVQRLIAKAKDIGIIVDRDLIARADELGDKFDTAAQIADTRLKVGLVALAPLMNDLAGAAGEFMRLMGVAYDTTRAIEQRQFIRPLQNQLAEAENQRYELQQGMVELRAEIEALGETGSPGMLQEQLRLMGEELEAQTTKAEQLLSRIQELQGYKPTAAATPAPDPLAGMLGRGGEGRIKLPERFYPPGGTDVTTNTSAADAVAARLESLRQSLMTEQQLEMDSHAKRLEEIQKFYESGAILRGEYDTLLLSAQQQHADRMTEITKKQVEEEARIREQLVGNVAGIFGSLSSLAESFGEKGLAASKAFGVAEAVVNTAQGITKALAQGGILGFAGAAAVAAAGAAQIATILSVSKGSSSKPSAGTAAPGSTSPAASSESSNSGGVHLTLHGNSDTMTSMGSVEGLINQINDYYGTQGKQIVVTYKGA